MDADTARGAAPAAETVALPAKHLLALSQHNGFIARSMAATAVNRGSVNALRRLRTALLEETSEYLESYLRSPAFLHWMKYHLMLMQYPITAATAPGHAPLLGQLARMCAAPRTLTMDLQRCPVSFHSALPELALFGKTAFVSGGSRGIGRACALMLAAAGADVAVASSPAGVDAARGVCVEIQSMGRRASAYAFDICCSDDVAGVCRSVRDEFDGIDILVNNAGVTRDRSFRKMERSAWDEVIRTDLTSVFDVTQAFIEPMAVRGWGRIINVSSVVGEIGNFGQANYAAAKAGLIGFTKTLAREYAKRGVTVNAIAPGFIRTRMLDHVPESALRSLVDVTPVGRLGEPMEVGASVLFLASPAAAFVTGHVLDVNGGMSM